MRAFQKPAAHSDGIMIHHLGVMTYYPAIYRPLSKPEIFHLGVYKYLLKNAIYKNFQDQ